ncbi:SAM complex subunit SAM50 [Sporobolomyces koalae]|uniref:SAM complex subunit SAM50 n=1 Tax=Sporobolomyces koalae TaxID=500713 RepID=UPI003175556F
MVATSSSSSSDASTAPADTSRTRPSPAEHAAKVFQPEYVEPTRITVQGPFIPTPDTSAGPWTGQGEATAAVEISLSDEQVKDAEAWQRQRLARRFEHEQERVDKHLAEIIHDNLDVPLRLNSIRFLGAKTTRPGFLSQIVAPYLVPIPPPAFLASTFPTPSTSSPSNQTLKSLLQTTRQLTDHLERLDIFRPGSITPTIVKSDSVLSHKDEVDLVFNVQEQPKYFVRTSTDVGDGEGNATGTAKIRNAFGGGETIEANVSFGTRTKSAFQVKFDTPVNASPSTRFDLSVFSAERDLNYFASCNESTKGFLARLRTLSPFGSHEFAYEAVLRQIGQVAPSASMSVRDSAGPSVKSAVSHTFTRDSRDDPFIATRGFYLKLKQEYAGLGGDANFLKSEHESSISRSLGNGYSVSFGTRSGLLFPATEPQSSSSTTPRPSNVLLSDRFHLGGPTSVRMLRPNTLGPRDNRDYVGGTAYWAMGASLITPVRASWPSFKGHVFVNAGKLVDTSSSARQPSSLKRLFNQPPSITTGFGLLYRHSLVRVEVNVGVPIVAAQGEGVVKGVQFGLGLSFL